MNQPVPASISQWRSVSAESLTMDLAADVDIRLDCALLALALAMEESTRSE